MDDFILQSSSSDTDSISSDEHDHFEIHHNDIFSKSVDYTKYKLSKSPPTDIDNNLKEDATHSLKLKKHPSFFNNVKQHGKMVTSKLIKTFSKSEDNSESSKEELDEIGGYTIVVDPDKVIQP